MIKNFGYHLIEESDSLLLAISGGIDSMVMLDIIVKIKNNRAGMGFIGLSIIFY